MVTEIAKGNWNELKGEIKKTWGKLSDDDLTFAEGSADEIIGKVQKAYGYTKDRAKQEFDSFKQDHKNYFHDSRGLNNQESVMAQSQFNSLDTNKIKNRASHMIEEDIIEPAQEYFAKAKDLGVRAMGRSTELVKENPGYTILGACAVGFLLGAYVARRR